MKQIGWILFVLGLASCAGGGSETGNPYAPVKIELQLRSTNPDAVAINEQTGGTVIEQAWFSFGVFDFIDESRCADFANSDAEFGESLLVADLAAESTSIELEINAGKYCGLLIPLQHPTTELPDGSPGDLSNDSLILKGNRSDGVAFTLAYSEQDDLEIIQPVSGLFSVGPSEDPLLLSFDIAVLLKDMNLDSAVLEPDGTIRIDEDHNRELLDTFEINLDCALALYADSNRNGSLDDKDTLLATCELEADKSKGKR